ncbi:sugar phosphate isomerase/epimerase family protein, partial [candidate division KSB1 bacterium]
GNEMKETSRRSFLGTFVAGAITGTAFGSNILRPSKVLSKPASPEVFQGQLKKSLYFGMLPDSLNIIEKFKLARRTGFDGIEVPTIEDPKVVDEIKTAARNTGLDVHSVMNQAHWRCPLSSSDSSIIKESMKGMITSLRNARDFGADTVLLVPAVVNAETSYKDAWIRSQKHIRELLSLAAELGVIIAVENVWNKFLVSPLEFARYVDEFESPFLKAYFDVGNIVMYGVPQDWIRTLGNRIVKVHIKGFHAQNREFVNLGDGTIDWLEVRRALSDIRYNGHITAELERGDEEYFKDFGKIVDKNVILERSKEEYFLDVSKRMDRIIAGEKIK